MRCNRSNDLRMLRAFVARPLKGYYRNDGEMPKTLKITQVRSQIGESQRHRGTLRALGLGRIGDWAEREESPQLEGMLRKVQHLVQIEEVS